MRGITTFVFLFFSLAAFNEGKSQTTVSYTSFDGTSYTMRAYFANYIVLLVPEDMVSGFDSSIIRRMTSIIDSTYLYGSMLTGKMPPLYKHINGKATVAYVTNTCGAGCGMVGATGIELGRPYFNLLYKGVKNSMIKGGIYAYEIGRNFWFYGDKVNFRNGLFGGWAEAMANQIFAYGTRFARQWKENKLSESSYYERELSRVGMAYILNDTMNYYDMLLQASLKPVNDRFRNPRALDYYGSAFLFLLSKTYGDQFIFQFYKELGKLPDRTTNQTAADNLYIAASKAVGSNLQYFFQTLLKFPISPNALNATKTLPNPKKLILEDENQFYVASSIDTVQLSLLLDYSSNNATYYLYRGGVGDTTKLVAQNNKGRFKVTLGCGTKNQKFWIRYRDADTIINGPGKVVNLRMDLFYDVEDKLSEQTWYEYAYTGKLDALIDSGNANNGKFAVKMFGENLENLNDEVRLSRPFYLESDRIYKISLVNKIQYRLNPSGQNIGSARLTVGFWGRIGSASNFSNSNNSWVNTSFIYNTANFKNLYPSNDYVTQMPYFNFVSDSGAVAYTDDMRIEDITHGEGLKLTAQSNSFCRGDSTKLTSNSKSNLKWYKDGIEISGANDSVLIVKEVGRYSVARNVNGICYDISLDVQVVVNEKPSKPSISLVNNNLVSSSATGNQWYFQNQAISGATDQNFRPAQAGSYTVQVSNSNCSSVMSDPFQFSPTGVINLPGYQFIKIYPNPIKDWFTIKFNLNGVTTLSAELFNTHGQFIERWATLTNMETIDLSRLSRGVYVVKIQLSSGHLYPIKIIKSN